MIKIDGKNYPSNAGEVLTSDVANGDAVFFLFKVTKQEIGGRPGYLVETKPDMPFAPNKADVRDKLAAHGVLLPTRKEIADKQVSDEVKAAWPHVNFDELYTGAAGVILHTDANTVIVAQNSWSKQVNKGKFNFSGSGLISGKDPVTSAFLEANEENAILFPVNNELVGVNIVFPSSMGISYDLQEKTFAELVDKKADNIQDQLRLMGSPHVGKKIIWQEITAVSMQTEATSPVLLSILGNNTRIEAHVKDDHKKMAFNMHYPLRLALPGNALLINPERFPEDKLVLKPVHKISYELGAQMASNIETDFTNNEEFMQDKDISAHLLTAAPADFFTRSVKLG